MNSIILELKLNRNGINYTLKERKIIELAERSMLSPASKSDLLLMHKKYTRTHNFSVMVKAGEMKKFKEIEKHAI